MIKEEAEYSLYLAVIVNKKYASAGIDTVLQKGVNF